MRMTYGNHICRKLFYVFVYFLVYMLIYIPIHYHHMNNINLVCLQRNPKVKEMRNKSFPYYDEFALIFGKDRAIGERAHITTNVVKKLDVEEANKEERLMQSL